MRTPLPPSGLIVEALTPGDIGFREAQHLARAADTFDLAAPTALHPRPDLVSMINAAKLALKVADIARRLTADAPPTSPALDASDDLL